MERRIYRRRSQRAAPESNNAARKADTDVHRAQTSEGAPLSPPSNQEAWLGQTLRSVPDFRWPGVPEQPARPLVNSRSCGRRGAGGSATALVTAWVGPPALRAAACAPIDMWGGSAAAKREFRGGEGGREGSYPFGHDVSPPVPASIVVSSRLSAIPSAGGASMPRGRGPPGGLGCPPRSV